MFHILTIRLKFEQADQAHSALSQIMPFAKSDLEGLVSQDVSIEPETPPAPDRPKPPRVVYWADESYIEHRPHGDLYQLIEITENEAGYRVVQGFLRLENAKSSANFRNKGNGLTDADVLAVRASSMAAQNDQKRSRGII